MMKNDQKKIKKKVCLKEYVKKLENDIDLLETIDLLRNFNKKERKYINTMFSKANKDIIKLDSMPLNRHMIFSKRENSISIELDYLIQRGLITDDELMKYILGNDVK